MNKKYEISVPSCSIQEQKLPYAAASSHHLQSEKRYAQRDIRGFHRKLWYLALLGMLSASLLLSGCGGFVGNTSGNAATGLLIALPGAVDFGTVPVGQKATSTVTFINKSAAPIVISQLNLTGQSFSASSQSNLPFTLAAGSTIKMTVEFVPITSGDAQGQLSVTTSVSKAPAAIVSLKGKGAAVGTSTLSIDATSLSFGNVTVNVPSTQPITLTSMGTSSVTISAEAITGAGFTTPGATFPITLNPGQSATVNVQFDPTATGTATGQLTFTSDSSPNGTVVVSLSGTGVTHEVDLSWNAPATSTDPVSGYNVYRSPSGSGAYQLISSTGITQTTYMDLAIQSGMSYDYIVKSFDASGVESDPSNSTSVTIQ